MKRWIQRDANRAGLVGAGNCPVRRLWRRRSDCRFLPRDQPAGRSGNPVPDHAGGSVVKRFGAPCSRRRFSKRFRVRPTTTLRAGTDATPVLLRMQRRDRCAQAFRQRECQGQGSPEPRDPKDRLGRIAPEVEHKAGAINPDYTSQACSACSVVDADSRRRKLVSGARPVAMRRMRT